MRVGEAGVEAEKCEGEERGREGKGGEEGEGRKLDEAGVEVCKERRRWRRRKESEEGAWS